MLPFFTELVSRTDEARRQFENNPAILEAVGSGMSIERYRHLLLELYQIVWHFNPTCAAAASRLSDDQRAIRYFLYEHTHKESGHEVWVANDLEAVGVKGIEISNHRGSADTLALIGFNYWNVDRREPASVLGMMYVLEVIASVYGGPFSAAVKESLLLQGESGVSFISSHATMDVEHMAELRLVLNAVGDEQCQEAVIESALVNFQQVTRIFSEV
jgi:hypothetical protein